MAPSQEINDEVTVYNYIGVFKESTVINYIDIFKAAEDCFNPIQDGLF